MKLALLLASAQKEARRKQWHLNKCWRCSIEVALHLPSPLGNNIVTERSYFATAKRHQINP